MNKLKLIVLTGCVAFLPVVAMAADDNKAQSPTIKTEKEMETFKNLDTDKSGGISSDEAKAGGLRDFAKADKNKDGQLDINEFVLLTREEVSAR